MEDKSRDRGQWFASLELMEVAGTLVFVDIFCIAVGRKDRLFDTILLHQVSLLILLEGLAELHLVSDPDWIACDAIQALIFRFSAHHHALTLQALVRLESRSLIFMLLVIWSHCATLAIANFHILLERLQVNLLYCLRGLELLRFRLLCPLVHF